jgi:ribonuclease E
MKKEMLINVLQPEECRIAIIEDGVLEELYVERTSQEKLVGNIYKGRIVNIEPSIQAAFVDFGVGRNGFLHVSDVDPQYFQRDAGGGIPKSLTSEDELDDEPGEERGDEADGDEPEPEPEQERRRPASWRGMRNKPPIQHIFKRGQEVLVQVIKEGLGTKGPTLSTYLSIPGRYLVLMPGLNRVGVSRKIEDDQQRRQLRDILKELKPPQGLGFIVRTAGVDRSKRDLQRDLAYLTRLWKVVVRRINKSNAPAAIYQESDMVTRTIRDIFNNDIDEIWVDEVKSYELAREFLQITMPRNVNRLKLYEDREPLFHKYRLEEEIAKIQQRRVALPNGGSIVIDQTEALVAIDVNSGNFRSDNNAELTAFRMNLAAAKEIARQLRLRDLGGVIVNDFIDMREERHRREVERAMRDAVSRDRARTKVLKISPFGIIEMTRQRIRPSLQRSVYEPCPSCQGTGHVKTAESMSIDVMRRLQLAAAQSTVVRINVSVHASVAAYLNNRKRKEITQLEEDGQKSITIRGSEIVPPEHLVIECLDASGAERGSQPTAPPGRHGAAPARPNQRPSGPAVASGPGGPDRGPEQTGEKKRRRRRRGGRRRGGRGRRREGANGLPEQSLPTEGSENSENQAQVEPATTEAPDARQDDYGESVDDAMEDAAWEAHNVPPVDEGQNSNEEQ